ncbi:MAG: DUF4097 domain-containing protein [Firmicutes bacterium]|nr:DUF4097 domain-containing protein [Bacillota bacterium]
MKNKKVGIFTLAILLITLGSMFLIDNFYEFKLSYVLSIIWPIFIILLGLELIFTKLKSAKYDENTKLKISGGSVFFIILILIVIGIGSEFGIYISGINILDNNDFIFNYKYDSNFSFDKEININDKEKIIIHNAYGDINVVKGSSENLILQTEILIKHDDEDYANEISNNIIEVKESGSTFFIKSLSDRYIKNNQIKDLETNMTIKIPEDVEIDIENKYGDIDIKDMKKSISIKNKHGNVITSNIKNDLSIENSYGEIDLTNIEGNIEISNKHGEILTEGIKGNIKMINSYDNVIVKDIVGNVNITNTHDRISSENITGNLTIDSKYCDIEINDIDGDLVIVGNNGKIDIEKVKGSLKVNNKYSDLYLYDISKEIFIINQNGDIRFSNNEIIDEKVDIENKYGDVDIIIPRNQQGEFMLNSIYGDISTDLDFNIKVESSESIVKDSIGSSTTLFKINTKNGDISISVK